MESREREGDAAAVKMTMVLTSDPQQEQQRRRIWLDERDTLSAIKEREMVGSMVPMVVVLEGDVGGDK